VFFSYLFPLLLSFLVTLSLIYLLGPLAKKLKLVDIPDHRKNHIGAVPLVGGLSVYGGVVVVCFLFIPLDLYSLVWLLASFIIVVMGVIDDAIALSSYLRLLIQFVIATMICFSSGLSFENIGSWIGYGDIHLGRFSYIVTLFCIVGSINAFNMMDGIDGLAGAMASISLAGFSILFYSMVMFMVIYWQPFLLLQ
jgi:UDP-GlcNAc:undecaprenyl-phosphate GlcNAc-1-phosphate transferase